MPSVGVPRLLTWPCSGGAAHWGQRELGLRAALTQSTFPWSATSEWKPGHPHAQVAAIASWACPQSQQLLVNTGPTHPLLQVPGQWSRESWMGCPVLQATASLKPRMEPISLAR